MRNLKVVLIALVAVLALGAVSVSVASAEVTLLAEWLAGGGGFFSRFRIGVSGTLKFNDHLTLFGSATVTCPGDTSHGTIGPSGSGEITSILNAAGKSIEPGLKGEPLLCEGIATCEKDASETELWLLSLPILTLLELLEAGGFTELFYTPGSKGVGWEVKCLVLGSLIEDTCSAEDIQSTVINNSGKTGVEATGETEPGASCTEGTSTSGSIESVSGNLISLEGSTEKLTISSEGAGE